MTMRCMLMAIILTAVVAIAATTATTTHQHHSLKNPAAAAASPTSLFWLGTGGLSDLGEGILDQLPLQSSNASAWSTMSRMAGFETSNPWVVSQNGTSVLVTSSGRYDSMYVLLDTTTGIITPTAVGSQAQVGWIVWVESLAMVLLVQSGPGTDCFITSQHLWTGETDTLYQFPLCEYITNGIYGAQWDEPTQSLFILDTGNLTGMTNCNQFSGSIVQFALTPNGLNFSSITTTACVESARWLAIDSVHTRALYYLAESDIMTVPLPRIRRSHRHHAHQAASIPAPTQPLVFAPYVQAGDYYMSLTVMTQPISGMSPSIIVSTGDDNNNSSFQVITLEGTQTIYQSDKLSPWPIVAGSNGQVFYGGVGSVTLQPTSGGSLNLINNDGLIGEDEYEQATIATQLCSIIGSYQNEESAYSFIQQQLISSTENYMAGPWTLYAAPYDMPISNAVYDPSTACIYWIQGLFQSQIARARVEPSTSPNALPHQIQLDTPEFLYNITGTDFTTVVGPFHFAEIALNGNPSIYWMQSAQYLYMYDKIMNIAVNYTLDCGNPGTLTPIADIAFFPGTDHSNVQFLYFSCTSSLQLVTVPAAAGASVPIIESIGTPSELKYLTIIQLLSYTDAAGAFHLIVITGGQTFDLALISNSNPGAWEWSIVARPSPPDMFNDQSNGVTMAIGDTLQC